ncbi:MAG: zinc ribbon domain-containing protein [Clostridia bacterium]|nr:zinc ribbon domain-containing protein [Clostridia bacterium]
MDCKFCGTDNFEDATFCRKCGKRLDGQITCPECGRQSPDDSIFCSYCGTRLSDKKTCEKCGSEYEGEGELCPACKADDEKLKTERATEYSAEISESQSEDLFGDGIPEAASGVDYGAFAYADAAADTTITDSAVAENGEKHGWKKWVLLAGTITGLLGVILAALFSFFVTVTPYGAFKMFASNPEYATQYGAYTVSLKWLFGDAWDVLKDKTDTFEIINSLDNLNFVDGYGLAYNVEAYVPLLFTFVLFITTIVTVFVNAIIAIVRYVGELRGKPNKGILKPTLATFFAYIIGACLIRSLWASASEVSVLGVTEDAGYRFGGATVAGFALTSVFLAVFLGSRIAVNYKSVLKVKNLVSLSASVLAIVFVSVIWSQATGAIAGVKITSTGYGSATAKYSMLQALQTLGLSNYEAHVVYDGDAHGYTLLAVMCILSVIAVSLVSSASMQSLTKHLNNAVSEEKKSSLPEAIVLTVFSIIFLVFAIVIVNEVFKISGADAEGAKKAFTPAVLVLVFAVLNLGVSIADIVLRKKFADKELI